MALDTVQDYVNAARTLLQDTTVAYRYPDSQFLDGLNFGLMHARRLRADLFLGATTVPSFTVNDTTAVTFDQQYRLGLVYFITGHVQMQDQEDTEDSRAAQFQARFTGSLVTATV
jgi:hypothetical protein